MPLISCVNCNEEISNRAENCPHCGLSKQDSSQSSTPSRKSFNKRSRVVDEENPYSTVYQPAVIYEYAQKLYDQAQSVITVSVIACIVMFGSLGLFIGNAANNGILIFGLAGAVIGGVIGYTRAAAKAAELRLQAQLALCQVQIEQNTRPGAN
jgi:hypothetical protein